MNFQTTPKDHEGIEFPGFSGEVYQNG